MVPPFDCPIYKGVFNDNCALFSGPDLTTVIIPAQAAAWFF
jgi:hypothetical protein